MQTEIVGIGEVLFDVFEAVALLAGAPLNAMAHVARMGHAVSFLSGVGEDAAGQKAMQGIEQLGLPTEYIGRLNTPTGRVEVTLHHGEPSYNIHRGVAYEEITLPPSLLSTLVHDKPAWMYYGTLAQSFPVTRSTTEQLFASLHGTRRFYDLNLRNGFDSPEVVVALLEQAHFAKLNQAELHRILHMSGIAFTSEQEACRVLANRFQLEAICVTRGAQGAALLFEHEFFEEDAPTVQVADTVGAGDAFSAALLHGLLLGWPAPKMLRFGNQLGSFVASCRGAIPEITTDQYRQMAES
ncbi:MAG: PfkB family carbohydrate kinase [Acidobacteriaceae bacterium]|nr:PfkB family carbohydrate kinase [Acidobacteriaceae bacterium]